MKFVAGTFQGGCALTRLLALMAILSLLLLEGCHRHHRSPPPAKSSATIVKRQLNDDGSYYVRKGDTLYAIAFSYGLDPMDVAKKNRISSPYTIYPGQKIQLKTTAASGGSRDNSSKVQINTVKSPGQVTTKTVQTPKASTSRAVLHDANLTFAAL